MYSHAEEKARNPFEQSVLAAPPLIAGLADPPLCGLELVPYPLNKNKEINAGTVGTPFAGMYDSPSVGIGAAQGTQTGLLGERSPSDTATDVCLPDVEQVDHGAPLRDSEAPACTWLDKHFRDKDGATGSMQSRQDADGELCKTPPVSAELSSFAPHRDEQQGPLPVGGITEAGPACEHGAGEPGSEPAHHELHASQTVDGLDEITPPKDVNVSPAEQTPPSKTALRVAKFTSDLMRLPAGLKEAGKYGLQKGAPMAADAWHQVGRAGAAGEDLIARHLPKNAGRWVENTKNFLGYATLDAKTIMKHIGGVAKGTLTSASQNAERIAGNALRRTLGRKSAIGRALAGRGSEKRWPAETIERAVEKETGRAEAKAGRTGGNFVERKLAAHAAKKAVMAETTRSAERAGLLATEKGAIHAGEKTAAKALEKVAVKEAASVGSKTAGKTLGKIIPGLNVAVSVGAAGLDLKEVVSSLKKRNYTSAAIEGIHAATDLAGIIPGVGSAVSLLGDALSIGAHWLTRR